MTELKPCPFCGGNALLESMAVKKGFEALIQCNCKCVFMQTITYDTEAEAIEAVINDWNRRFVEDEK